MTTPITIANVLALLEEATLSEPGVINPEDPLLDMEAWDSMGMVMFIGLVEENYKLELSVADLRDCTTPQELAIQVTKQVQAKQ